MVSFRPDWINQVDAVQREMERLLDHFAGSKPPMVRFAKQVWEPAVDLYETEDAIIAVAELAGVKGNGLEIIVNRDRLTLRGERKNVGIGIKKTYHQMEISSGPFERVLPLPVPVDPEKARASQANGLVKISMPRIVEEQTHTVNLRVIHVRRPS